MRILKIFITIFLTIIVTGCVSKIENSYTNQSLNISYSNVGVTTDGTKLYFTKHIGSISNIYFRYMNNLTQEIALTNDSYNNFTVRGCSYGNNLIYSSNKSGKFKVYKLSFDNTNSIELISSSNSDLLDAIYSRDGKYIIFTAIDRSNFNHSHICMVDSNGTNFKVLTSSDSLKRKPTISSNNKIVIFQKKVNDRWGLYYIDLNNDSKIENEFFLDPNFDSYDPEFLPINSNELVFVYGKINVSSKILKVSFINKVYKVIKDYSNYYYFSQPTILHDENIMLYIQRSKNSIRENIFKMDLNSGITNSITY